MHALIKTTWVELKLFSREPLTVVFTFAIPFVFLVVLGSVFGNHADPTVYRGFGAMEYYVPAYIGLVVAAMGLIALPVHLATYQERGILRRFRASSIPVWSIYGAQVAVTFVVAILASVLLVLLAVAVYHIDGPLSPAGVIAAIVLGVLAFAAIGLFLGVVLPTARAAQGAGVLLWFVMMLISGPGPPFEVLSAPLRMVGDATPLKHLVILIQDPWLGFGWNGTETLAVGGFLVLSTALAFVRVHRG